MDGRMSYEKGGGSLGLLEITRKPKNEGKKSFELKVYPNPARQNINVNINSIKPVKAELIILNVTGNIVYRNFLELNENITRVPINLEIINPGIYFLTVTTINFTKSIKFMISH